MPSRRIRKGPCMDNSELAALNPSSVEESRRVGGTAPMTLGHVGVTVVVSMKVCRACSRSVATRLTRLVSHFVRALALLHACLTRACTSCDIIVLRLKKLPTLLGSCVRRVPASAHSAGGSNHGNCKNSPAAHVTDMGTGHATGHVQRRSQINTTRRRSVTVKQTPGAM